MIKNLKIRGYRCFTDFHVDNLAPVNLLVGKNNCGKTALLEAIELVSSTGNQAEALLAPLRRRGELAPVEDERPMRRESWYEVNHLFRSHQIDMGSSFEIVAGFDAGSRRVHASIVPADEQLFENDSPEADLHARPLGLRLEATGLPEPVVLPLVASGQTSVKFPFSRYFQRTLAKTGPHTAFITTDSLSAELISRYWASIVLTAEEALVIRALRILDPDIQRIAIVGGPRDTQDRMSGVRVKRRGEDNPVPIGSLGDGIWHMLRIAIALVRAREGVLLVDEIDTGLHHTVMDDMWKLIIETAHRLKIQVFATTHSYDCIASLGSACREMPEGRQVSVQRIDAQKNRVVAYSQGEIRAATRHATEMR